MRNDRFAHLAPAGDEAMSEPSLCTRFLLRYALKSVGSTSTPRHDFQSSSTSPHDISRIYLPSGHWWIHPSPTSIYIYYTIAPFFICITIFHVFSVAKRIWRRWRKRRCRKQARIGVPVPAGKALYAPLCDGDDPDNDDRRKSVQNSAKQQTTSIWQKCGLALRTAVRNGLSLRVISASMFSVSNYAELLWTLGYCATVLIPTFVATSMRAHPSKNDWANPIGVAAFAQIPLIIALSSRNNLISFLTGVSYQELNYLHRASGRLCLLCSWMHTIGWLDGAYDIGTTGRFSTNQPWMIWGFVALSALTALTLTSFRIVRQLVYEFFLFTHIVFSLLFLIGAWFHWDWTGYWVLAGLLLWFADRFISLVRMVVINKLWLLSTRRFRQAGEGRIEIMEGEVMRMTVKRPSFTWKAGQHAYISCPSIGWMKVEQHPMSISNMPNAGEGNNEVVFLIKAEQGFTRRLYNELGGVTTTTIPTYIDGPYGVSEDLSQYSTVLLVAGGTGITHVLSHAIHLLSLQPDSSDVNRLHIIWNIRHAAHLEWVTPLLARHFESLPEGISVQIDIHVTRSHVSDGPGEERVQFRGRLGSMMEGLRMLDGLREEAGDKGAYTPEEEVELEEEEENEGRGTASGTENGSGSGSGGASAASSANRAFYPPEDQDADHDHSSARPLLAPSESHHWKDRTSVDTKVHGLEQTNGVPSRPQFHTTDTSLSPKTEIQEYRHRLMLDLPDRNRDRNWNRHSHPSVASLIHWHAGRANLGQILRKAVEVRGVDQLHHDDEDENELEPQHQHNGPAFASNDNEMQPRRVAVLVCGPKALIDDTARAVREINTAKSVWQGGATVDFYRDTFGW